VSRFVRSPAPLIDARNYKVTEIRERTWFPSRYLQYKTQIISTATTLPTVRYHHPSMGRRYQMSRGPGAAMFGVLCLLSSNTIAQTVGWKLVSPYCESSHAESKVARSSQTCVCPDISGVSWHVEAAVLCTPAASGNSAPPSSLLTMPAVRHTWLLVDSGTRKCRRAWYVTMHTQSSCLSGGKWHGDGCSTMT
jgi:hypothetical protein